MTLYSISEDYKNLLEMAEQEDLDPQTLADTLEGLEGEYEEKLDNYAIIIKKMESDMNMLETEMARLKEKKDRTSKNIARMKEAVFASMKQTGHKKVQCEHFTWAIQRNGGKAPIKITKDFAEIPDTYKRIKYDLDTDYVRLLLEAGEELDFAHLGERSESLRLK